MNHLFPSWLRLPYRDDTNFGILFFTILTTSLFFFLYLIDAYEAPRLALLMVLIGSGFIIASLQHTWELKISKPLAISLIVFGLWYAVASILSLDSNISVFGYYARRANSLVFALSWVAFIFFLTKQITEEKKSTLLRLFVFCAVLVSIVGVIQSFGIGYYAGINAPSRPIIPGLGGNQNFSAMYIVGIIPMAISLLYSAQTFARRAVYALIILLLLWSVMVFASRGAIVALFGALLFGFAISLVKRLSWKMNMLLATVIVLSAVFAYTSYSITRVSSVDTSLDLQTDMSTVNRLQVWVQAVDLIKMHPLTGLGPGNFLIGYKSMGNTAFAGAQQFDDPHNLYLLVASTTGIPGILFLLCIIGVAIRSYIINFWKTGSIIQWGLLVGLVAFLISATFNPVTIANWILLAFLIGCSQASSPVFVFVNARKMYKGILITIGALLIVLSLAFISSEYMQGKIERAYKNRDFKVVQQYAPYAQKLNPFNVYPKIYSIATDIKLQKPPHEVRSRIDAIVKSSEHSAVNYQYMGTLSYMLYEYSNDEIDRKNAFAYFARTNELDANYTPVLTSYAYIAYKAGDAELARRLVQQSLSLSVQKPSFLNYVLLAEIQLEHNELEAMAASLRAAYEMQPQMIIKAVLDKYDAGTFNDTRLPIYFPPIDII